MLFSYCLITAALLFLCGFAVGFLFMRARHRFYKNLVYRQLYSHHADEKQELFLAMLACIHRSAPNEWDLIQQAEQFISQGKRMEVKK
jgi:hypothetical protein